MTALEQELLEQFKRLDTTRQKQVLDFVHRLAQPEGETDWEHQPWTDDEIRELMTPKPRTGAEIAAWLEANPPAEPWGDLRDDEDAAEYVQRMRRQSTIQLDEPDDQA